jgi:hypothetical protein
LVPGLADVDVPRLLEDPQRVLLGVGVEVPEQEHVVGACIGGELVGEVDQGQGLPDPVAVERTLTVSGVGVVARRPAAAAL